MAHLVLGLLVLLFRMPVKVNLKACTSLLDPRVMPSAGLMWATKQLSSNNIIAFLLHTLYFVIDHCAYTKLIKLATFWQHFKLL